MAELHRNAGYAPAASQQQLQQQHSAAMAAAAAAGSHNQAAGITSHEHKVSPSSLSAAAGVTRGAGGEHSTAAGMAWAGSTLPHSSQQDESQRQQQQQQQQVKVEAEAAACSPPTVNFMKAGKPTKGKNGRRGTAKSHLKCKVDDCPTVLSSSKAYYQRHRVCAVHLASMSAKVDGVDSRFCQQCGKFQPLTEFDQDKRSCRSRLKRHNNRRREQRHNKGLEFSFMTAAERYSDGDGHYSSAAAACSSEQQQDGRPQALPGLLNTGSDPSLDDGRSAGAGFAMSSSVARHTPGGAAAAAAATAAGGVLLSSRSHMRRSSATRALQALRTMNAASSNSTASEYEDEEGDDGHHHHQQQHNQQRRQEHQRSLFGVTSTNNFSTSAARSHIQRPGSAGGGPMDDVSAHASTYGAAAATAAAYQRFSHPGVLTTHSTPGDGSMYRSAHPVTHSYAGGNAAGGSGSGSVSLQPGPGFDGRAQPLLSRFAPYNLGPPATVQYMQQQGLQMHVQQQQQWEQQQQQWGGQLHVQQQYQETLFGPWSQQLPQQHQQHQQQRQQHYHQLQQRGSAFRGPSGVAAAAAAAPSTAADAYLPPLTECYRAVGPAGLSSAAAQMPEQHSAPPQLHATASGTFLTHGTVVDSRFSDVGGAAMSHAQGGTAAAVGNAGMTHCWSVPVPYRDQPQQQQQQPSGSTTGAYLSQQRQQQLGYIPEQQPQHHPGYNQQQPRLLSSSTSDSHLVGQAPLPYDADVATQPAFVGKPDPGSMSPTPAPKRSHHSSYPGQLPPPPKQQLWPTQPLQQQQRRMTEGMQNAGHMKPEVHVGFHQGIRAPEGPPNLIGSNSCSRAAQMDSLRAAMQAAAAAAAAASAAGTRAGAPAAEAASNAPCSIHSPFSTPAQQVQGNEVSGADGMLCSAADRHCMNAAGLLGNDLGGINLGPGQQQQQLVPPQPGISWQTKQHLQHPQQLMAAGCETRAGGSSSSSSAAAALHKPAAVAVAPGHGSAAPGGFPVPASDMFRAMSGADEDFSELFDLLLEGTEQQ